MRCGNPRSPIRAPRQVRRRQAELVRGEVTLPAVIFDCDGVLVDSEKLAARAMSMVLAQAGLPIDADELMHLSVGLSQRDILAAVGARLRREVPATVPDAIWPATRSLFAAELQAMPGIEAVLRALAVPIGVASSSLPERIAFSLHRTGLDHYFGSNVFSSQMVRRGKPAPDLFLRAAERMAVAPAECIVIEDSVAGTIGACAAGMRVLGFVGGGHATAESAGHLRAAGAAAVAESWEAGRAALRAMLPQAFADPQRLPADPGGRG